jgi:3-methylcrotonyl-CoA carboxylase alpha subunit
MSFRRLLVANRGEIAVRIMRACREAGIESVAVYSEADRRAPHIGMADHRVLIGPAPAAESYLSIPAILEAARIAGADSVHPGYGFLAENSAFAEACVNAGLVFVGPPADAIARMGSKILARQTMAEAGVPVVPGMAPADQSERGLAAAAENVGFPVLIKASAGGGGKGLRMAGDTDEVVAVAPSARREAQAAFGDGTLYVERLLDRPRHVEIQVMADRQGRTVHLFERDCSIQRRHQKIVEESPSPALSPALRARIGSAAVAAARAIRYENAGTVEFLLEGQGDAARFYFLEMNTRLQVEHPVTEAVTGVDLVRAQLAVAAGAALPWTEESLSLRGHAIECRVYAEDPMDGFLPQAGRVLLYREPTGPGIRIDAGVELGSDVTVHYDPLLAKLIAHGETRTAAIARAIAALERYAILGLRTNVPYLRRLLRHPAFQAGEIDTGFVDRHGAALAIDSGPFERDTAIAAAVVARPPAGAAAGATGSRSTAWDPWRDLEGWRG